MEDDARGSPAQVAGTIRIFTAHLAWTTDSSGSSEGARPERGSRCVWASSHCQALATLSRMTSTARIAAAVRVSTPSFT